MSYADLHFDAKTAIASTSVAAWNALMRADPVFGRYALSEVGRSAFIAAFTVVADGDWTINGRFHRVGIPGSGGPARSFDDGREAWFEYGELHRADTLGPAVKHADGSMEWYERGQRHRIGGPAGIYADGTREWYEHNQLHRVDGPAIIYADGGEDWYCHGKRHRVGGPARIFGCGLELWFEHGEHRQPPRD